MPSTRLPVDAQPPPNPEMSAAAEVFHFPPSFGQEQLWYLHELAPDSTAYNIAFAFELHGELDKEALEQAFAMLVQRHDALRTGFAMVGEQLTQVVRSVVHFQMDTIDLGALPAGGRGGRIKDLKWHCARRHFDLSRAPLLHVQLVKLTADQHILLLCLHHIVVDHISVIRIGTELGELYGACRSGAAVVIDDGRLQFPDFAVWQREQMTDTTTASKVEHWRGVLDGKHQTLDLPTDRPRRGVKSFRGAEWPACLPQVLSADLRAHAQRQKQSLFVVILSALAVVLHKYSGHGDVIVGCPMANRQAEELHAVVGLFMNVLPIPIDVDPRQGFDGLSQQVRRQVVQAQGFQDTPFEMIVRAGQVAASAAQNPLVQVLFTFQEAPLQLALPGLRVVSQALDNGGSKLDLSLWYWDDGEHIRGLIEYNSDLFDEATVQAFEQHLAQVLRGITEDPAIRVEDISLLTASDLASIASRIDETARADVLPDMHGAFFARAAAQPGWIALETACGERSAGELATLADAIGQQLQQRGVVPGDIVGVCLERGEVLLASLLGVLRCGGAYLPLDPSLPAERIAYMLEDSRARHVIAEPATRTVLPVTAIAIVMADTADADTSRAFLPHTPAPGDIAYLMYTSGSTGKPKGVRIPHGAVGNLLSAMRERPGIQERDVWLALTTYAFDISVLDLFLPLAWGAKVWLADRRTAEDGMALRSLIQTGGITVLQATPSTWRLLRTSGWEGKPGLKGLTGGEALSPELAKWLVPRIGELWNLYGPTETTVYSSGARIDASNMDACPIGRPIANTTIHIVDEQLRRLPAGVPGELVIAGKGLSLGYHDRQDLTEQAFVRLPETGEAVYRTGDLALWRRDGQLQHLGRKDSQVKVRGFRIELGEIETVLASLREIDSVAVSVWRVSDADHRLVAYYTTRSGSPVPAASLREHARGFLPDYMLPQHFVALERLPLLPSGKVNRDALPAPIIGNQCAEVFDCGDMTSEELTVLNVCRELIGSHAIGLDENFFDAGGHSLLAVTMASRLEKITGTRLSILKIATHSLRALASDLGSAAIALPAPRQGFGTRLARWARAALAPRM